MSKWLASVVVILGLLAAACTSGPGSRAGSGETPTAGPTAATPTAAPTVEVEREILAEESPPEPPKVTERQVEQAEGRSISELQLREYRFSPPTLTANAGETFNFRLFNYGKVKHNFTIVTPESGRIEKDVSPRIVEVLGFLAPKRPGRYQFSCRFHRGRGMVGTLVVR
jgi:plastocyanin